MLYWKYSPKLCLQIIIAFIVRLPLQNGIPDIHIDASPCKNLLNRDRQFKWYSEISFNITSSKQSAIQHERKCTLLGHGVK